MPAAGGNAATARGGSMATSSSSCSRQSELGPCAGHTTAAVGSSSAGHTVTNRSVYIVQSRAGRLKGCAGWRRREREREGDVGSVAVGFCQARMHIDVPVGHSD